MDKDARERLGEEIDPKGDIREQLSKELRDAYENPQYSASDRQVREVSKYWADESTASEKKVNFKAEGKTYIKTADNKFREVDSGEVAIYSSSNGYLYILDDDGNLSGKTKKV